MNASDTFFDLVKTQFAPMLRTDGFKGSGRTFRRIGSGCVHLVNLQTSMSGGQCAVNLAIEFAFLPGVDATGIQQHECDFRRRLCPDPIKSDYWWDFGDGGSSTRESVSHLIETYVRVGVPFFSRFGELPGVYADITTEDLRTPSKDKLPGGTTEVRYALKLAQMWLHLQQPAKAKDFIHFGLATCGPMATGIRGQLKKLLNEADQAEGGNMV